MEGPPWAFIEAKLFITARSRVVFLLNIDVADRGNLLDTIWDTYLEYRGVNPLF